METSDKLKKKRSFPDAWLSDERFKFWIRKVPFDNSLFHCVICNKNFSCSSVSHVTRHAKSAHHKKNIENPSLNNNVISKKISSRRKIFKQRWLEIERFKPWLREVEHDENLFFCMICDKTVAGGLSQIYRHSESKIHKDKIDKNKSENCDDIQANESNKELNVHVDKSVLSFDEQKKSAEIRYAALIADKNIPHETAKVILHFFQNVGKYPDVLKSLSVNQTKCTNIISNVLCPAEMSCIEKTVQNTKLSIIIDETLGISSRKWMTFFVRYVNSETSQVHSQLVKLIEVDAADSSTEKLLKAFKHEMWELKMPFSNIIALSCDNASTLTGKYLAFKKELEESCKNILILSCPCHSAALAVHAACAEIPQVCEEFVEKVANYINSSPKRSSLFCKFSECYQERKYKIVKLPDMRWLSHYAYIEKLLKFWDVIKHLISDMVRNEKPQSEENLLCIMQNVDTKAYLLFLKYSLRLFTVFDAFFQTAETRIHLLQLKSMELLIRVCRNFLKPEVLSDLPNVAFDKIENHKALTAIDLGSECEEYLCQLMMDGYVNAVAIVRQNCLQFYVTAAEEIFKRLPVNDIFLSKLKVFLPQTALSDIDRETSFNDLSLIAKTIGFDENDGFDENGLRREWFTLHLDFTATEKQNLLNLNFDDMWIQILQSQYEMKLSNEIKYPNLRFLLNSIRSLPNLNAGPERTFLTNKPKKQNTSAAVNAICVLNSALKTKKETLNMKIDIKQLFLMSSNKLYANFSKKSIANNDIAGPSCL